MKNLILILLLFTSMICQGQISAVSGYSITSDKATFHAIGKTSYGLVWFNYSGKYSITNFINVSKNKKDKTNVEAVFSLVSDTTYAGGFRFTVYAGKLRIQPYLIHSVTKVDNIGLRLLHPIVRGFSSDLLVGYKKQYLFADYDSDNIYLTMRLIYKLPI